ncbi:MAG: hypothetical protein M3245_05860 [Actinomycetota bacterium]|nr:hypothetical protein [Actinomycetota bacterium]
MFWYHPHVREDYAQEMGLYGAIVVEPSDPGYWPPVNREVALTLDDVLIEDGRIAPFSRHGPDHTAMGRFGNVFLVNGETEPSMHAAAGEVIRLYLINTANTRVFNVALPGATMKLVGGDNGRYEREELLDEILLAPSERAVVDVLFDRPGRVPLEHRTPDRVSTLGSVWVSREHVARSFSNAFQAVRRSPDLEVERSRLAADLDRPPDKTLALVGVMRSMHSSGDASAREGPFACPMHPEVQADDPGRCPKCGMYLVPAEESSHGSGHADHGNAESDGIEWEDTMPEMNRDSTPTTMR